MSKGIVIVNTRKVSVNLTSYDEKMLEQVFIKIE